MSTLIKIYSAGPGLFPRDLPGGARESWDDAQARVRKQNSIISSIPFAEVITPSDDGLAIYPEESRSRACLVTDLYYATSSDVTFADMTPFGGREPDSGTVVEATACALSGKLLVLWADPLTTFAERYADADVHPDSDLDKHYNLMIEQLYYWSWETHFGFSRPVFASLREAVAETASRIKEFGLNHNRLLDRFDLTVEQIVRQIIAPPPAIIELAVA